MKKYILLFFNILGWAQPTTLLVYDTLNRQAVAYAELALLSSTATTQRVYANKLGQLQLLNPDKIQKIQCVTAGYENTIWDFSILHDTLYVERKSIALNEVLVTPKPQVYSELGYHQAKKTTLAWSPSKGIEMALFVENPKKAIGLLKSFCCKVRKRNKHTTAAFKLHLYTSKASAHWPEDEITPEHIVFYIDGKVHDRIEIDLATYGIAFPASGLFVGIECLGEYDKTKGDYTDVVSFDTAFELNDSYQTSWSFSRLRAMSNIWGNLKEKQNKMDATFSNSYVNFSFGVRVLYD